MIIIISLLSCRPQVRFLPGAPVKSRVYKDFACKPFFRSTLFLTPQRFSILLSNQGQISESRLIRPLFAPGPFQPGQKAVVTVPERVCRPVNRQGKAEMPIGRKAQTGPAGAGRTPNDCHKLFTAGKAEEQCG